MVTVRLADCRALTGRFAQLLPLLTSKRRETAARIGDTPAGRQCLAAGLLLAEAFGREACEGMLQGAWGKPYLPGARCFSLSHAGDYAVLATGDGDLGVDIERTGRRNAGAVAERFFHPEERRFLAAAGDFDRAFTTLWTLKESFLKAEGCGFSRSPSSFCILPAGDFSARMAGESGYFFRRYPAPEGYVLSVCARDGAFPDQPEWAAL